MFGRKRQPKAEPVTGEQIADAIRRFDARAGELEAAEADHPDGPEARALRVRAARLRDAVALLSAQTRSQKPSASLVRAAIDSGDAVYDPPD